MGNEGIRGNLEIIKPLPPRWNFFMTITETIAYHAPNDGNFAIAYALIRIAEALEGIDDHLGEIASTLDNMDPTTISGS